MLATSALQYLHRLPLLVHEARASWVVGAKALVLVFVEHCLILFLGIVFIVTASITRLGPRINHLNLLNASAHHPVIGVGVRENAFDW